MGWVLICLAVAAGCGRIGFGEPDGSGSGTGIDGRPVQCTEEAPFTCGGSPSQYIQCSNVNVGRAQAEATCIAAGGHLPWIGGPEEAACLAERPANFFWVGLRQSADATEVDAGWGWPDNSTYLVWAVNEPNDNSPTTMDENHEQDCAILNETSGLYDEECDGGPRAAEIVCELSGGGAVR